MASSDGRQTGGASGGGGSGLPGVPFGRRIADLARGDPSAPAVTCGDDHLDFAGLDREATSLAARLSGAGVGVGDMVTIAHPNSVEFVVAVCACWKVGAIPQPVSHRLPEPELRAIIDLADSRVVLGAPPGLVTERALPDPGEVGPLPADPVSPAWKAPTSGGSTGRPKLIVSGDPALFDPAAEPRLMMRPGGCLVMPGPLYHNGPFVWSFTQLLLGGHVVLLERFDPVATLAAVERHRADVLYLVPTMMNRIWRLGEDERNRYDLSSLRVVWHLAAPCPAWLKEEWIRWLGPERVVELYGGTEGQAATVIGGVEWLERRGSVGRPVSGEIRILDEDLRPVPPGVMGEVWMRPTARDRPTYRYVGAEARRTPDGWESLGDMGWMDEDGYLYLGDRRSDMILTGGSNVYPAEVEAAILRHPEVRSCAVYGVPDDDLGQRVCATVEGPRSLTPAALRGFLAAQLVSYKIPRDIEIVDHPVRDDAGKVRRSDLAARHRSPGGP